MMNSQNMVNKRSITAIIPYSGKQITHAGEKLLNEDVLKDPDELNKCMDILSYWRLTHESPLEEAFKILQNATLPMDDKAFFAKRLKRFISIVNKLKRFRTMKLKNMQDIGGCRAIVSNVKKVYKIVRVLKKRPEFKLHRGEYRFKDYIKSPKPDGYRGYHLVGQFKGKTGEKRLIEFQLRTKLQHDWATAVEIVDLFTGQALKSNQGQADWESFFKGVSDQFAIMEGIHLFNFENPSKRDEYLMKSTQLPELLENTQRLGKRLSVRNKFSAFANSIKIVHDNLDKNIVDGYALIRVNTFKKVVKVDVYGYGDKEQAVEKYLEAEKEVAGQDDLVVALVSTTAVGGIKEAYPNYFADSTEFLKHYMLIEKIQIGGIIKKIFG